MTHCKRECAWDEDMTHCTGCKLLKAELKSWYKMTEDQKKAVLKAAEARKMLPSSNG